MEPGARGRSPASRRVTQKLGGDTVLSIPYRPRKDASKSRKTAAVNIDTTVARRQDPELDFKLPAAADALSLSGTTPPTSPTISNFPVISKSMTPDSKTGRPQLVLTDAQGKVASKGGEDASFRKHNRGIGSIDSLLSSTTYVNTQSECSRAESRLSREIRIEVEDTDAGEPVTPHRQPKKQTSRLQLAPPSIAEYGSVVTRVEGRDFEEEDEAKLVDEISSLVLRNSFGKDLDDCAAPLLVWDCTYRYLQELWSASHEGNLGFVQATSGHGTPTSHHGGTPASSQDQQNSGLSGKGKRKADGGSDDGSGFNGRGDQGDDERDISPVSQVYSTKGSITNYSCPYRKRNPLRFNVRDYFVCATHSFADMSQLKKHIRAHHPPVQRHAGPFSCPRCSEGFITKNDLDSHLRQPEVCRISFDNGGTDPEDGITQKIISSLEARSLKAKIDNWISLWKLLFPKDPESQIPNAVFVPVMEVFDFISESKRFLDRMKDLLEIQYRHIIEGASQLFDVELKIHQGLERSANSIYTWIETVVQDWEKRIAGTVSPFTSSAISQPATSDSWASTPRLPPSPAPTPTVVAGNTAATGVAPGTESPGASTPAGLRGVAARKRSNPQVKRAKRPDILPKIAPPTQIPLPIQRARTPQPQARVASNPFGPAPAVLPSQSVPMPPSTTQGLNASASYHGNWDAPAVTVSGAYPVSYTSPSDGFPHPAMATAHYQPIHPNQLEIQPSYLGPKQPETISPDAMHDIDPRPQSAAAIHVNRLTMSTNPRSSLGTLSWIQSRDENRDSSQTLVEAHPPGRCANMYCPSCNKTLPDDMMAQPSPVGIHPVTGAPQHHTFHTSNAGQGPPFQTSSPGEVHGFNDQVWSFNTAGGGMPGENDHMFGGGHHGPQAGY
ncbi:uncharacterized protein C8A04DRAFT_36564 [Dichotomopilus funicola]|uniref:C2H2-type domain-containing protein n=1 Tax=Dichotomopilus funicola TaxID=1934379 RepID=A0AAN6V4C3_9PEZI|nr:hypothetical protein C8A04DRAFT_36564 [Dichotomopilus funicola]